MSFLHRCDSEKTAEGVFYCREGMKRSGPFRCKDLRRRLIAGIIDTHTLVAAADSRFMLPLGASAASGVITGAVTHWRWQFSPVFYWLWMIVLPLMTAAVGAYGISYSHNARMLLTFSMLLGQLGMTIWLYWVWRLLLADKPGWLALFYALPMAVPGLNCLWMWISYMTLPRHWRQFNLRHHISEKFSARAYYMAASAFYLMNLLIGIMCFTDEKFDNMLIYPCGVISWIWFGLTLFSLFICDKFTASMVTDKLSNLAFGTLRFGADVNYDILHRTVILVRLRLNRSYRMFCGITLLLSWMVGGWLWMTGVDAYYKQAAGESAQSALVKIRAVRLGK